MKNQSTDTLCAEPSKPSLIALERSNLGEDFHAAIDEFTARAWDAWIWGDAESRAVHLVPSAPGDRELAGSYGLRLVPSAVGLVLLHAGHETEAT